jgi:hypothetical protein
VEGEETTKIGREKAVELLQSGEGPGGEGSRIAGFRDDASNRNLDFEKGKSGATEEDGEVGLNVGASDGQMSRVRIHKVEEDTQILSRLS